MIVAPEQAGNACRKGAAMSDAGVRAKGQTGQDNRLCRLIAEVELLLTSSLAISRKILTILIA